MKIFKVKVLDRFNSKFTVENLQLFVEKVQLPAPNFLNLTQDTAIHT